MTIWNDATDVRLDGATPVAVRLGGTGEQVWPSAAPPPVPLDSVGWTLLMDPAGVDQTIATNNGGRQLLVRPHDLGWTDWSVSLAGLVAGDAIALYANAGAASHVGEVVSVNAPDPQGRYPINVREEDAAGFLELTTQYDGTTGSLGMKVTTPAAPPGDAVDFDPADVLVNSCDDNNFRHCVFGSRPIVYVLSDHEARALAETITDGDLVTFSEAGATTTVYAYSWNGAYGGYFYFTTDLTGADDSAAMGQRDMTVTRLTVEKPAAPVWRFTYASHGIEGVAPAAGEAVNPQQNTLLYLADSDIDGVSARQWLEANPQPSKITFQDDTGTDIRDPGPLTGLAFDVAEPGGVTAPIRLSFTYNIGELEPYVGQIIRVVVVP